MLQPCRTDKCLADLSFQTDLRLIQRTWVCTQHVVVGMILCMVMHYRFSLQEIHDEVYFATSHQMGHEVHYNSTLSLLSSQNISVSRHLSIQIFSISRHNVFLSRLSRAVI